MKQSTKLLSLVLAIIMAFSCVSVIGSAVEFDDPSTDITYDSIDDALLTPEQVADIALDLVDGLLTDAKIDDDGIVEFDAVVLTVRLDLRTIDGALQSIVDLTNETLFGTVQSLAGDAKNLSFDALKKSSKVAYQRGDGNIVVVRQLLKFLSDNTSVLKKAPYGIMNDNTDKDIDLGKILEWIGVLDMSEINDLLDNLDVLVGGLIYDMLLYGSYRHQDMDAEELEAAGQPLPYGGSLDGMIENALLNLVVDPQDYTIDEETDEKIWDENSVLIPSLKASLGGEGEPNRAKVLADLDLNSKSVFDVINYVAQYAIDDLGVTALNNNLKKGLMEAVEVEFVEIDPEDVPADVKAIFDDEAAYTTYIGYDCMEKDDVTGDWYYTTKKTQDVLVNGKPQKDENGNIITERVRKYYKANTAVANEFYNLINWDYEILKSTDAEANSDATAGVINCIDYNYFVTGDEGYGSIVESLNHIIYIVYNIALTDDIRADFEATTGAGWVDGATSGTLDVDGKTEKILNYNINRLVKYLLANFSDKIFGSDSAYADKETYTYEGFWADKSIIDIAALLGPSFFEDVMPQLIIPVDGDGAYAFATSENGSSVALLQFGAIVLREFMTEIAPNVNYDAYIFAEGTLTSAEGRQFADLSADKWFNLILNMGIDIGYTYLYNITNFGDKFTFTDDGTAFASKSWRSTTLPDQPDSLDEATSESRWMGKLDDAIDWAMGYIGQGSNGVLIGINPDALVKYDGDPFAKLSYVLNTVLPLGFVNGCESDEFDLDLEIVFNKLKAVLTTFDLTQIASLFGRNGIDGSSLKRGNILAQPVIPMVLNLVNDILALVFNVKLLNDTSALDNVILQSNLSILIERLFPALYNVSQPLFMSALPVVGKLIKGWGTEQNFEKPSVDAPSAVELSGGATKEETIITVKNGADGIWRSWIDANGTRQYDAQYQIELTGVKFYDFETGSQLTNISAGSLTSGKINYGKSGSFVLNVSGQTTSVIVRMDISYKVYEGDKEMVAGATYTESVYTYLTAVATDAGTKQPADQGQFYFGTWSPIYIDLSGDVEAQIKGASIVYFIRESKHDTALNGGIVIAGSSDDPTVVPGSGTISDRLGAGGSSSTRYWEPIQIFNEGYAQTSTGKKTDTNMVISGSVIDMKNFDKEPGDKTNMTFSVSATEDKSCGPATYTASATSTFVYYDGAERGAIASDILSEIRRGRVSEDYLTTGYSYADRVLATETTIDEETGEKTLKETNSTLTAWVDMDGEPLADGITVTPDEDNEETGKYYVDGVKHSAKLVTKIDNSKLWATYVAAVKAAASAGLDGLNINGNFSYGTVREDLNAAATDIGYAQADGAGDSTVGNAIDDPNSTNDLKGVLDSVEATYTDNYDYTDYMMWRINRLNDARDDASYYINLKKDADRGYSNVDKKFPYTSIEKDDLQALVALADNAEAIDGNGALILALLEDLTSDEEKSKKEWLEDRDKEYANVTAFDIALAKSMLTKTSQRLRDRDYKVNGKAYVEILNTEIASAEAMYPASDEALYTERSWTKYEKALAAAKAAAAGDSQKVVFDAKWELLCCRNELVLVENEADYSELETLIAQAEYALSNQSKYDNTAKELGQVLAELGLDGKVVNADGYDINLFPGSAIYTNAEPYTVEDQDIIDSAADQLKEALARLKFYNVGIAAVEGNGDVDYAGETTIVFDDPETKDVDESVIVKLATIGAGMNEDAVKALFNVTATGATVGADNVTVSNDRHYSVERYEIDEETGEKVLVPFKGFAGTNSVVTFYTVQDGIKIPVATIKLIVNGDINGDGTVDVLDAAQIHLANKDVDMATLEGCYFVAGNLAGATDDTRVIDGNDYTQVVNLVVA